MLALDCLRFGAAAPPSQPMGGRCRRPRVVFDVLLGGKLQPDYRGKGSFESRWEGGATMDHSFSPDECEPEGREVT